MKKAIFLDRDGVLNKTIFKMGKPRAPYSLEEFELLPGVEEAIRKLKSKGYLLIVVTNQPDVSRGWVSLDKVHEVNNEIKRILKVDDLKACFHDSKDNCECRKPRPGMLLESARNFEINLTGSFMIGDRESDVEAGMSAGCKTILIGQDEVCSVMPHYRGNSLLEVVQYIPDAHN